jgi:hypothetical protein
MKTVKRGDALVPSPLWNRTEREWNRLPAEVEVMAVKREQPSQSGIMIKVVLNGGGEKWLDAEWFVGPA